MDITSQANSKVQKMDWLDILFLKLSCIAFGILLVMLISGLKDISIYWVIVAVIILAAKSTYNAYLKK